MAWSPVNISSNSSSISGHGRSARDLHYPYAAAAHQYPPSLATEPSMFSDNQSPCNTLTQHPFPPVHHSYPVPFASAHAEINPPNHNTVHYSLAGNSRPGQSSTMAYLCSGHSTAYTPPSASGVSTPSMQDIPKELRGTYQCNWRDCKYRGVFSRKGVLMRHIETQHVAPRSFDCPVCGNLFCRRDNLTEHLGRVHRKRT
ncbi:uncharacterized protein N7500_009974 [Penicillium coprophilum]|uniref:uncharacterized protein n=1 Tax=Penicillium coprophilum TaxID=36646 RepID=UPI002384CC38|nr:uncharacterized protein N7500_009974 [Penicillium coprophilum]KAJ5154535.1 hypothetical protein N7500_009974 [Penicillium coprophilum]